MSIMDEVGSRFSPNSRNQVINEWVTSQDGGQAHDPVINVLLSSFLVLPRDVLPEMLWNYRVYRVGSRFGLWIRFGLVDIGVYSVGISHLDIIGENILHELVGHDWRISLVSEHAMKYK